MSDELTTEQRERVQDFIAALRSGEYAQTINQLGKVNDCGVRAYCCEGVAAERYAAQFDWTSQWIRDTLVLTDADENENVDYADDEFWELMGLSTGVDNGTSTVFAFVVPDGKDVLDTGATGVSFMALNDGGFTFEQIADLIQWQFLGGE